MSLQCDTCLDIGCDYKITIEKGSARVTRAGKSTNLVMTCKDDGGVGDTASVLNADCLTKTYFSTAAVHADWDADCPLSKYAEWYFRQDPSPEKMIVGYYDKTQPIGTQMDAVSACAGDWFTLATPDLINDPLQTDFAAWASTFDNHAYAPLVTDLDVLDPNLIGGTVAGDLKAAEWPNTILTWTSPAFDTNGDPDYTDCPEFHDGGIMGVVATQSYDGVDEGLYTLNNQSIVGATPNYLTKEQYMHLLDCNINVVICQNGKTVYRNGRMLDGQWFDRCHAACWIKSRLGEVAFQYECNQNAIAYDQDGLYAKADAVSVVMRQAQIAGILAGGLLNTLTPISNEDSFIVQEIGDESGAYQLIIPRIENVSDADRAERTSVSSCIRARVPYAEAIHGGCYDIEFL